MLHEYTGSNHAFAQWRQNHDGTMFMEIFHQRCAKCHQISLQESIVPTKKSHGMPLGIEDKLPEKLVQAFNKRSVKSVGL